MAETERTLRSRMAAGGSLVREEVDPEAIAAVVARWTGIPVSRLVESEREKLMHLEAELHRRVVGQDEAVTAVGDAGDDDLEQRPWSQLQPWLAHEAAFLLADLLRARADCGIGSAAAARWVTATLQRPREHLDPPPLLTGNDLLAAGVPAGRAVGQTLAALRTLQLDGQIVSRDAALEWVHVRVNAGL
jgi:hypothetical protein